MNWLNIPTTILRDPNYVGSPPVQRATWLNILVFSVESENSGRISGANKWKSRQWQQTCGVTLREVQAASKLITIEGDDVLVYSYPIEKELEVKGRREAGRFGGSATTAAKSQAARSNGAKHEAKQEPKQEPKQNPTSNPTEGEGEGERNENRNNRALALPKEFPANLDTLIFQAVLKEWILYREERKLRPYQPKGMAAQLKRLSAWGHDVAVEAINFSMAQGYQGIYPSGAAGMGGKPAKRMGFA